MTTLGTFRHGLLDPTVATPEGLNSGAVGPADKRYDVYRNNVTVSLIDALGTAFPLVRKILGAQRFDALAPAYVRAHPPTSPMMMYYGSDFPSFLAAESDLEKFGYLADCARLDLALRASYHAADAIPFDLAAFQNVQPDQMMQQKLQIAPSSRILKSRWPLYDIWRFNMVAPTQKPRVEAQDVVITRPHFDPEPHLLPVGAADFLTRMDQGHTIADASDASAAVNPDFDLGTTLTLAFSHGVFCSKEGAQHVEA